MSTYETIAARLVETGERGTARIFAQEPHIFYPERGDSLHVRADQIEHALCFTCGTLATHRSKRITPAGYYAYQCERHAHASPLDTWGSDPGWPTLYEPVDREENRR